MVTSAKYVEVEICNAKRRRVQFRPLGANALPLRSRTDASNARNAREQAFNERWPLPIPGERVWIDFAAGTKGIREPLHDEEYEQQRALVLSRGFKLLPKKRVIDSESVTTWAFHLHKLVNAGSARVVVGELPPLDTLEGEPRKSFVTDRKKDANEKLADVMDRFATALDKVAALLGNILERMDRRAAK